MYDLNTGEMYVTCEYRLSGYIISSQISIRVGHQCLVSDHR
jgi:hypothetical protein